jgi:hypothetical protein
MAKKAQLDAVRPALEAVDSAASKVEAVLDAVDAVADKGTDVVEAGLEKVADVVPEALDSAVHVSTEGGRKLANLFRNPKSAAVAVVILTAAAGAGLGVAGYRLAVKRLKSKMQDEFDIQLESELSAMKRFYETRYKDGRFSTPAEAVDELLPPEVQETIRTYRGQGGEPKNVKIEGPPVVHTTEDLTPEDRAAVMRNVGYTEEQIAEVLEEDAVDVTALRERMASGTPVEVTETVDRNIFVDGHALDDFDYAAEVAKRDPDIPYVITHDEFMENENGWTHQSLTYFNGDDVLVDDQQMPIPDIEEVVDSENLTKFGHGSRDPNVVYVRNERLETEFEITMRQTEFGKEVAGLGELKHSAPLRKFRGGDE